jgi:hypothetical protein
VIGLLKTDNILNPECHSPFAGYFAKELELCGVDSGLCQNYSIKCHVTAICVVFYLLGHYFLPFFQ